MGTTVTLPDDVAYDLDLRVSAGDFTSRDEAAAYYIRKGLGGGPRRDPRSPSPPPGPTRHPSDDRPIQVDPTDVNWVE